MATNPYFSQKVSSEQTLMDNIIIESIQMYGQDVYYLPRDIVRRDTIINEDIESEFNEAYMIEMYIENIEGFEGEGNIFQKFGMEIRDECTFIVAKSRYKCLVGDSSNGVQSTRPVEGDLIYLPLSHSVFEITFVEHEQPFYQLNNITMFKLRCALYEHNDEDFDTGVAVIDKLNKFASAMAVRYGVVTEPPIEGVRYFQKIGNTGETISGRIVDVKSDFIYLTDVETSDGLYHEFTQSVLGDYDSYLLKDINDSGGDSIQITSVVDMSSPDNSELFENDPGAQNSAFEDAARPIISFDENNPFGEP